MTYPNQNRPAHLPATFRWLKYDGTYYMSEESWAKNGWDYPTLQGPGEFVIYRAMDDILCVPTNVKRLDDTQLESTDKIAVGDEVWMEVINHGAFNEWTFVQGEVLQINEEESYALVRFNGGEWMDVYPVNVLFLKKPEHNPMLKAFIYEET
jgi:hypothetical protein